MLGAAARKLQQWWSKGWNYPTEEAAAGTLNPKPLHIPLEPPLPAMRAPSQVSVYMHACLCSASHCRVACLWRPAAASAAASSGDGWDGAGFDEAAGVLPPPFLSHFALAPADGILQRLAAVHASDSITSTCSQHLHAYPARVCHTVFMAALPAEPI